MTSARLTIGRGVWELCEGKNFTLFDNSHSLVEP
jgi:hypothetical protein